MRLNILSKLTGVDHSRLMQKVKPQEDHEQALFKYVFVQAFRGERISKLRVRKTQGRKDEALVFI